MLQIKYFLCLRPSVKTSNYIIGILMSDMENPSARLQKTLKPQFPSGNIDPRKVFETCHMFCDELFLSLLPSYPNWGVAPETLIYFLN